MLRVLLRSSVVLVITFVVLIGVVRYTAQAYAVPQHVFSFDPPDCYLPCVFGVTPGKTAYSQYNDLIASKVPVNQQIRAFESDFWLKDDTNTKIEFYAHYYIQGNPQKIITSFTAFTSSGRITTLGKLLNVQHMPVRVFRYQAFGPGGVALIFVFGEDQRLVASVWAKNQVNSDAEVHFLTVLGGSENVMDALVHVHVDEIRWLGFASADKYLNAPIKH